MGKSVKASSELSGGSGEWLKVDENVNERD